MIGFNKIVQVQPGRQTTPSRVVSTPLGVQPAERKSVQNTPMKRTIPIEQPGSSKRMHQEFSTPRRPFLDVNTIQNAPIKKRVTENIVLDHDTSFQSVAQQREARSQSMMQTDARSQSMLQTDAQVEEYQLEDSIEIDDAFPANQMGLYDGGFGDPKSNVEPKPSTSKSKVGFERVNEETVEMGGFILPGGEKKQIHKSYNWIAGRSDGQYRVVLGYNTLFKPKNAVDSTTGEKDFNRWRVVRFENRYKENYPYTEFPAKYLDPLIQALEKAREQHELETKEDSIL